MPCKRGEPPQQMVEENLTTAEVLAKYTGGPQDGVFTDGSANPNPGPGGWGAVYVVAGEVVAQAYGHSDYTTNNKMELTALIEGFELVPPGTPATLYTDSKLVEQTINAWAKGWQARGWKRKGGDIKNLELVQRAYALHQQRPEIRIEWIKAHNGSRWNEYADSLSTAYLRTNV
jgi:ribonuclease HI